MLIHDSLVTGRQREDDMPEHEFLNDIERVKINLEAIFINPETSFRKAQENLLPGPEPSKRLRIEDGVPISEYYEGYVDMALLGYKAGIWQDADGMLYVGADEIPDEIFSTWGLTEEKREDRGRTDVSFYLNEKGEALFKKLYKGFVVVISRNLEIAKGIAKAVNEGQIPQLASETFGHTTYEPAAMQSAGEIKPGLDGKEFLRPGKAANPDQTTTTEIVRLKDQFYLNMGYIKGQYIFLDALEDLRKDRATKKKPRPVTSEDINRLALKIEDKMKQKMDELRYIVKTVEDDLRHLPANVTTIMDMAGGAGDLGLALSVFLRAEGRSLNTKIVDPFTKSGGIDVFTDLIIDYLPFSEDLRASTEHTYQTIQETKITPDSIVVAKHPCGDLCDSIIENWIKSESPLLVIMTCCQEKAANKRARYGLPQEEWTQLCNDSGKTNSPNPAIRSAGVAAMSRLDLARVEHLKRFGFEASLTQNPAFPKGDIIVARRKTAQKK